MQIWVPKNSLNASTVAPHGDGIDTNIDTDDQWNVVEREEASLTKANS